MKVGVVGHVEWVQFVRVDHVPVAGEIVTASETWEEAGGGGGMSVAELARLAGSATLFTALGDDELGRRAIDELEARDVQVHAVLRPQPQRRAFTLIDRDGERTITLLSEKLRPRRDEPLPWDELGEFDAIYFTGGDPDALRAARAARVLVSTARELPTLLAAGVYLDALVASSSDPAERYAGELDPRPGVVVTTAGAAGGTAEPGGAWAAAPLPGAREDSYGAGDCFAAGLTFGLGAGRSVAEALELAAASGAAALSRRGAHG